MASHNSRSTFLLAASLAFGVRLDAQSAAAQGKVVEESMKQIAPVAPPDGSLGQATLLMQQGKNEEALKFLESIAAAEPARRGVVRQIGIAYYRKNDFLKAAASFKKALEEDPGDNEAVQLLGLSYYLAGRPAEAIGPLEKVQTWYPSANVDASYILGICYIQTKDYPGARKSFAKMFAVPAESAASYLFTGRMLFRHEYDPVAEEYAKKAVELDPRLPLAHALLGELYLYKSRVPEAIEQFQKELELNPGEASAYYKLADGYSRLQKYDEAGAGEERGDRPRGACLAARPGHGSQQSHPSPLAWTSLPGIGQDGRRGARTEARGTVAGAAECETLR